MFDGMQLFFLLFSATQCGLFNMINSCIRLKEIPVEIYQKSFLCVSLESSAMDLTSWCWCVVQACKIPLWQDRNFGRGVVRHLHKKFSTKLTHSGQTDYVPLCDFSPQEWRATSLDSSERTALHSPNLCDPLVWFLLTFYCVLFLYVCRSLTPSLCLWGLEPCELCSTSCMCMKAWRDH